VGRLKTAAKEDEKTKAQMDNVADRSNVVTPPASAAYAPKPMLDPQRNTTPDATKPVENRRTKSARRAAWGSWKFNARWISLRFKHSWCYA